MSSTIKHIANLPSLKWNRASFLFFVFLTSSLMFSACGHKDENEDDKVHVLDKKYISESELFALNKAIDEEPENPENYFKRSKVYYSRRDYSKALDDIRNAIKFNGGAGKYYLLKSFIFHEMSEPDSALFAAQTAERLNINTAELKFLLAQLHLENGNRAMAEVYILDAEAIAPDDPQMHYLYGKRAVVDGDTNKAIPSFYSAIHLDTTLTLAYKELAGIYFNKHKYDSTLVFLTVGKMKDSQDPYFDYIEGKVLEQLNMKSSSKALFIKALAADSTFSQAYNAIGMLYHKEGKDSLAIPYFEKEVRYNPYNNAGLMNLAHLYEKTNNANKAVPLLQKIVSRDSTYKNAKAELEKLYLQYPELKPKPKPKADTTNVAGKKDSLSVTAKADSSKVNPVKPQTNPATPGSTTKPTTGTTTQPTAPKPAPKKNSVPRIANPDSMKIETRPDSIK